MKPAQLAALALTVAGILGLVYGGFTYTKDSHTAKLGPLQMTVKDKETVNIPIWLGAGATLLGLVLLVAGNRK